MFASHRSASEFNKGWPLEDEVPKEDIKTQFNTPEYKEWYRGMKEKNNIK